MDGLVGAVKVKDGLFLGDELAAQDLEFVVANKVTHIINCSGREIANHWESIGVLYRTYYWADTDTQVILDVRDAVVSEVFSFIEEALEKGESALVHSARGQSRAVTVLLAYLMRKYRWTLGKTLQFMDARTPVLGDLRQAFHRQLLAFEKRLVASLASADPARFAKGGATRGFSLSSEWCEESAVSGEELVLVNTFNNAELKLGKDVKFVPAPTLKNPRKLVWNDKLEIESTSSHFSDQYHSLNSLPKQILKFPHSHQAPRRPPSPNFIPPPSSPAPNSARPSSPFRTSSTPRIAELLGLPAPTQAPRATAVPPAPLVRPPSPAPQRPQPIRQLISSIKGGPVRVVPASSSLQPPSLVSRPFSAQPQLQSLPSRAPLRASSPVASAVRPPFSSTRPPTPPIHRENFQLQSPSKSPLVPTLRPRSAAGVLRRAPSPTPAFNKIPPSASASEKQRWRT